jgi:hypothetical protein
MHSCFQMVVSTLKDGLHKQRHKLILPVVYTNAFGLC